jgi:tetratricopeptide (TPR) repeat protein
MTSCLNKQDKKAIVTSKSKKLNIQFHPKLLQSYWKLITISILIISLQPISNLSVNFGSFIFSNFSKNLALKGEAQTISRNLFKFATLLYPWNSKAHLRLGNSYEDIAQKDKAIFHLKKSHEFGSSAACSNLGRLYILENNLGKAKEVLDSCRYLIPDNNYSQKAQYYKNLGWLFYEMGDLDIAEEQLNTSLGIIQTYNIKNNGKSNCLLAKVLEEKGTTANAMTHIVDCLDLAKNYYPEVKQWQDEFRDLLNNNL